MKKNKVFYIIIMALSVVLVIASFIINVLSLMSKIDNIYLIVTACISIIALLSALYYLSKGHKKDEAIFLKYFTGTIAVAELINLMYVSTIEPYFVLLCGLSIVGLTVLTVGKDLGVKLSFTICSILLLLKVILLIVSGIKTENLFGNFNTPNNIAFLRMFADFTITLITSICIYAKYIDKAERKNNKLPK